jgi:hypothetical protein
MSLVYVSGEVHMTLTSLPMGESRYSLNSNLSYRTSLEALKETIIPFSCLKLNYDIWVVQFFTHYN